MNARECLEQIRKSDTMINNKYDAIQKLHDEAIRITPEPIDGMKVKTTLNPDRKESIICTYLRMEQELRDEIQDLYKMRKEIIKMIEQLPTQQYNVLFQIYILGRKLQEIAINEDRSYSWVVITQRNGINTLQKIIDQHDQNQ